MKKVNIAKIFGSELKELMRLLRSSGKECYIVGGAVRDLLLGYEKFTDIDLTTSLSVEQLKQMFDQNQISFDDRALKYGCLSVSNQKRSFQITSFRKDIRTFGRAADIELVENIEEDSTQNIAPKLIYDTDFALLPKDISTNDTIFTVQAEDANDDPLTFSINQGFLGNFEILIYSLISSLIMVSWIIVIKQIKSRVLWHLFISIFTS